MPDDPDGIVEYGEPLTVANEFTTMIVRKALTPNGERLEVTNPRTRARILLDAMQLEIISVQPPEVFTELLGRSLRRAGEEA